MEIKKMVMLEMIARENKIMADMDYNHEARAFWEKVQEEMEEQMDNVVFENDEYNKEADEEIQRYYELFKELKELKIEIDCDLDEYTRKF